MSKRSRMRSSRWLSPTAAILVVGAVATGCSSSHHKPAESASTTTATTTTTVAATTTSTTTPDASTVTAAPSTTAGSTAITQSACGATALTISLASYQGAGGTGYYAFDVVNHGTTTCLLNGYFGVSIYGASGPELAGTVTRAPTTVEGAGPKSISLSPGKSANFVVSVIENGTSACVPIGAFHLIPPNTSSSVVVDVASTDQGGYCGSPKVEPTQPGSWS